MTRKESAGRTAVPKHAADRRITSEGCGCLVNAAAAAVVENNAISRHNAVTAETATDRMLFEAIECAHWTIALDNLLAANLFYAPLKQFEPAFVPPDTDRDLGRSTMPTL